MKKIALKSIIFLFMAIFTGVTFFACNDDDEKEKRKEPTTDSIRIDGKIIGILGYCEGNRVVISVTNKDDFGESGTYYRLRYDDTLYYNNAIGLPVQEPLYALEIGTEIVFDCRQTLPEDYDSIFGDTTPCFAIY